jgi:hypothetical protein
MALITRYPVENIVLSKSSDSINIQSQSIGTLAANTFPELETYASTVFLAKQYSYESPNPNGVKFLKATDSGTTNGPWTAKTKHIALDAEVTTMTRSGAVILRYANNQGLFMLWSQGPAQVNGGLLIGHCVGVDETQPSHVPNGQPSFIYNPDNGIIYNSDLTTTHGVIGDNYDTDTFTFGVNGFLA